MGFMNEVVVGWNRRSIRVRENIRGVENRVLVEAYVIRSERQPVLLSYRVVDFGHDLIEVLAIRFRIKYDAFGIRGLRQEAQQLLGSRVDRCSGNANVRCRRNCCRARITDVAETSPLIAGKEKRAVFEDWSPDRPAELVPL